METKMLRWTAGVTRADHIRNDVIRERFSVAPIVDKMVKPVFDGMVMFFAQKMTVSTTNAKKLIEHLAILRTKV
ncbi:hypothetical protein TELCIR_00210 [Teladorsagia circumcincta]|uniref:Uncharacterized protein n=1 Tax=Teladorsagia circumcincta TaxID=45464 RepID=A0A2G9V6N0_TELCI|nr:hypothetical protein TELCIR_00210 [Teladorsagia circumcincta]